MQHPTPAAPAAKEHASVRDAVHIPAAFLQEAEAQLVSFDALQERLETAGRSDITSLLRSLLVSSIVFDASDIHIEPRESDTTVRFRTDGILHDIAHLPTKTTSTLISRIKLLSKIKLNVTDKPQDGRFSFAIEGQAEIEARVATIPTEYGESLVLRVLNPQNLIALEGLGLRPDLLSLFRDAIKKPTGMVIATGPTGSGKTTTLYAVLKEIQRPEIKIVTIEDPIEYHVAGISQTQVTSSGPEEARTIKDSQGRTIVRRKGYTFATGLQAIMRQDPDVILVGEIRDKATAQIALQAALTGHLVLSTLHTNDAPGTISRLLSLGAKPINIAAAINLIIAQRLARKVCSACVTFKAATASERKKIVSFLEHMPEAVKPPLPKSLKLPQVKGCTACNTTGYKGRIGVFEAIKSTDEFEQHILTAPSIAALRKFAIEHEGMVTLYQDGLLKVLQQITTLEEIDRVAAE